MHVSDRMIEEGTATVTGMDGDSTLHRIELLAPAGGEEQMDYAIRFGADAVYLGCERFGMRARSTNFTTADLPRVVGSAHERGVKVHVACNVAMHQGDLADLPGFLSQVAAAKADALIVGDLGATRLAREYAPDVQIHVSTQASVCNAEAARAWFDMGANRVVAAREMSLEDIALMKRAMPEGMELEVFAHGAMCMAYSGRCLVSDFMNGRSGIRGNCSQSCRWKYGLRYALEEEWRPGVYYPVEEDGEASYILNADDLCMLEHLDDLRAVGVDSIKIEGRNKKAYYVACVVNAYRQVLDGADPADLMRELDSVSHRPYSTGFFYGRAGQTPEELVYIRKTAWAAQVLACEPLACASFEGDPFSGARKATGASADAGADAKAADAGACASAAGSGGSDSAVGLFRAELRCRDKWSLSHSFEVLSPGKPVRALALSDLVHIPASRLEALPPKRSGEWPDDWGEPYPVDEANHPGERYYVTSTEPLLPMDIIRMVKDQAAGQGSERPEA